jgi:cell division protein FtsL
MKNISIKGASILACLMMGMMGLLLLWERNTLVELGLEIQQLQKAQKDLMQAQHELLIEISSLSSYRRIEEIATTQMGMIRPDPHQLVKVVNQQPVHIQEKTDTPIRVAERTAPDAR